MMLKRSHGEMRTAADGSDRFSETFHSSWNISKHFCEWAGDGSGPSGSLTRCSVLFHQWFLLKLWNFNVHSVWVMRSFPFIDWWLVFTFLDTILTQDSMDMCVDCGFYVCSKPHSMEIMKWFDSRMRNDHHQIFIRYYKWGLQGKELSKCASKTWDYSHQNFVRMQKNYILRVTIKAPSN